METMNGAFFLLLLGVPGLLVMGYLLLERKRDADHRWAVWRARQDALLQQWLASQKQASQKKARKS